MPRVNARSAAAEAMRLYDTDADGRLDATELAACPAMLGAIARYDQDGDGHVSQDEIADRLAALFSSEVGALPVSCSVTHRGRPLEGATVRFVPEPILGGAVQTATGTTDAAGNASLGIPTDRLPPQLQNLQVMQPGIFRVEIEHPALSSDGHQPLGFEVDPASREGSAARFDL